MEKRQTQNAFDLEELSAHFLPTSYDTIIPDTVSSPVLGAGYAGRRDCGVKVMLLSVIR